MLLSSDDKHLIQEAILRTSYKQTALAADIKVAPSTLSDCLRDDGKRSFKREALERLFEKLEGALSAQSVNEVGKRRIRLKDLLDDLEDAKQRLLEAELEHFIPGQVLPEALSSRFRFRGERSISTTVFKVGGPYAVYFPPKMGATSFARRLADECRSHEWSVRYMAMGAHQARESKYRQLLSQVIYNITESDEYSKNVEDADGAPAAATAALEAWAQSRQGRTLVIIDRLDQLIDKFSEDGEEYAANLFNFCKFIYAIDNPLVASRVALLFLSVKYPITLNKASPAGLLSQLQRQINGIKIEPLEEFEIEELGIRLSIESQNAKLIRELTHGNIFLSHTYLYLLASGLEESEIESSIKSGLSGYPRAVGVAGHDTISQALRDFSKSMVRSFQNYLKLIMFEVEGELESEEAMKFLRELSRGEVASNDAQGLLGNRLIQWLIHNTVLSIDAQVGLMSPIIDELVVSQEKNK